MRTLKCSDFLISAPKVKFLQGVRMDPICSNLSIRSKINVNKKSWYSPHLNDNLKLIIFMCRQSYWWRRNWKKYIFPVETISILKMTPQEILKATPRPVLWKRCSENILKILSICQKFLAILYHKQTYERSHFL